MPPKPLQRPELTLPEQEAAWITQAYEQATSILEYGSGGSTVLAAEMPDKTIFSVESDATWAKMLEGYIKSAQTASHAHLHHVDIGKTGKWGYPNGDKMVRNFADYSLSVWDRDDFVEPDTILIDGRFRVGCMMAALFRSKRPVTVYFDDYEDRPYYWVVEEFVTKMETRGRMARFEVAPIGIPADRLSEIIAMLHDPR
ncbi:hypothetical protein [Yoonia sp.]|uniref:hypothetical protein n=1 Tax=Yoonia sp. TaxID=2212373 RepID=UPI0025F08FFA|nr:hypothetical protein [Yoonia sp.]